MCIRDRSYNWVDQSYTGISGNYYKYQDPDAVLMQLTATEPSILSVANDFIAYPNPSTDHHITFSGETNMDEIVIFNTLGSMIYEAKPKATSITVSLQDPGMYFAKLS